jgi:putative lipoprotein (rSAM/lipoprotein system)
MRAIFWSALVCVFGFLSGCRYEPHPVEYGPPYVPEYGSPYAHYRLSGYTYSVPNNNPIRGIRVRLEGDPSWTYSGDDGSWKIDTVMPPLEGGRGQVSAVDVDGPDNIGQFDSMAVTVTPPQTEPGEGWCVGTFEQDDIGFPMHKQP